MHPDTIQVPAFARAVEYAGVWAIEETRGAALWDLCRRTDLAAHVASAGTPRLQSEAQVIATPTGQRVAVIPVAGMLMKAVGSMDAGTSTVQTRRDIRKAAADPEVSAILLAVDSPGGTVSGTADLAAEVRAAAKQKPTWAFVEDLCASAAYWVASQADRIFANNPTALVGSIGTLAVVYDLSAAAAEQGVKALVFGTGPLKGAGIPGAEVTEDQQAYFRGIVEDAQRSFDAGVRKGRSMTDRQLEAVKTGGVFGATEALSLKLIDGIKSFDQTIAELAAEARRNQRSNRAAGGPLPERSSTVDETTLTPAAPTAQPAPAANAPTVLTGMPDVVTQMRQAAAAESARIAAVRRVCAGHPAIEAEAIGQGWTAERAENAALKASLATGVGPANPHAGPHLVLGRGRWQMGREAAPGVSVNDALEAAVRMSLGSPNVEKDYGAQTLQAAHESFRHIGLQQLLLLAAAQSGHPTSPGERVTNSNIKALLRAAFRGDDDGAPSLRADASTISMSGILGNVANKELLAGYVEEDMTWKEIAAIRSVSNFQQVTSYRMLDDMEYEQVGPDGRIKHGTAGQESYTRQANTYAKMFALTRTHFINDDLGAFQDIRTRLGRGSAKKFNKVFWAAFINNSAFFTSGRTNYISGSTTNLGTDGVGLGLGVKAFRTMKSPAGTAPGSQDGGKRVNADTQNPVGGSPGGRPEVLLVPPELEGNAEVTYRNQNLGYVGNSTANIYQNKYRPVVAWQLSDSAYTGYSTTAWYLLNNPAYLAAVVVSFLNGMMAPTVESADADFDTLGVQFRGYHDFGCDQAEYLSGVKSKGAA